MQTIPLKKGSNLDLREGRSGHWKEAPQRRQLNAVLEKNKVDQKWINPKIIWGKTAT